MTHTSSICDCGTYDRVTNSGTNYPLLSDMVTPGTPAYCNNNFFNYAPGSGRFNYSNFGAGIMTAAVESVTGKRFSDYAKDAVFELMELDASFLPNDISNPEKIANIYSGGVLSYSKERSLGEKDRIGALPIGQLYRLAQGNLYISSEDLAKLMIVIMGDGTYEGKRILSTEAVHMMNAVQWSSKSGFDKMRGLNLDITDDMVKGRRLRGHQGRAYGSTAEMFYDIDDKTGVVYLSNGSIDKKASNGYTAVGSEIAIAVYDMMD